MLAILSPRRLTWDTSGCARVRSLYLELVRRVCPLPGNLVHTTRHSGNKFGEARLLVDSIATNVVKRSCVFHRRVSSHSLNDQERQRWVVHQLVRPRHFTRQTGPHGSTTRLGSLTWRVNGKVWLLTCVLLESLMSGWMQVARDSPRACVTCLRGVVRDDVEWTETSARNHSSKLILMRPRLCLASLCN